MSSFLFVCTKTFRRMALGDSRETEMCTDLSKGFITLPLLAPNKVWILGPMPDWPSAMSLLVNNGQRGGSHAGSSRQWPLDQSRTRLCPGANVVPTLTMSLPLMAEDGTSAPSWTCPQHGSWLRAGAGGHSAPHRAARPPLLPTPEFAPRFHPERAVMRAPRWQPRLPCSVSLEEGSGQRTEQEIDYWDTCALSATDTHVMRGTQTPSLGLTFALCKKGTLA